MPGPGKGGKMDSRIMKLDDDMLEGVSGGVDRIKYTDNDLEKAGVTIKNKAGKKVYSTMLDGKRVEVSESVAFGMCDCYYNVSGGAKLTDSQLRALISQS